MFGTSEKKKAFQHLMGDAFEKAASADQNAVFIDVRTPAENRSGSIPNSLNIDIMSQGFANQVLQLDKSKSYFVYCRSGARSASACAFMSENGLTAFNLSGGIGEWPGEIV